MLTNPRRPDRVLLTTDAVGGAWTHAQDLARGLAGKGIEIVLAVLGPRARVDQVREAKANPSLTLVATELPLDWLATGERELDDAARVLSGLANRYEADLVHLHAPALAGRRPWELPLVVTAHSCVGTWWSAVHGTPMPPDLAWRARRTRQGLALADAAIAPSRSFAEALAAQYGLANPVSAVPNGRSMLPAVRKLPFTQRSGVMAAGRLWDRGKDIATLDRAAALLGVPVVAAGPAHGPNGEAFGAKHMTLLGTLDGAGLSHRLAQSAVFVSPSVYEPFGLTVLEAANLGCPLVLADIPTFRELWGGVAAFFAPRRADRLVHVIEHLLAEPGVRHRLGRLAEARARRYSVSRMVSATLSVYARAFSARDIGRRRPARAA